VLHILIFWIEIPDYFYDNELKNSSAPIWAGCSIF